MGVLDDNRVGVTVTMIAESSSVVCKEGVIVTAAGSVGVTLGFFQNQLFAVGVSVGSSLMLEFVNGVRVAVITGVNVIVDVLVDVLVTVDVEVVVEVTVNVLVAVDVEVVVDVEVTVNVGVNVVVGTNVAVYVDVAGMLFKVSCATIVPC